MPVERTTGGSSLIDVLDRVLDKGIIIDAWVRVSLVGIDLITVEARVVVASIDTYLRYADALGLMTQPARAGALPSGPKYRSRSHQFSPMDWALSIEHTISRMRMVRSSTSASEILMSPATTSPLSRTRSSTSTSPLARPFIGWRSVRIVLTG